MTANISFCCSTLHLPFARLSTTFNLIKDLRKKKVKQSRYRPGVAQRVPAS